MKAGLVAVLAVSLAAGADTPSAPAVANDGTAIFSAGAIPYSDLASAEQKQAFLRPYANAPAPSPVKFSKETTAQYRAWQDEQGRADLERLSRHFGVVTTRHVLAGVPVYVSLPKAGVPPANRGRVLINLHGGSFVTGGGAMTPAAAIPLAGLGKLRVVSVDYRMAPDYQYPAASDDVIKVYRALLRGFRPQAVGILGCSTGALLTAQTVAWLAKARLPRPGAIGIFGEGAMLKAGDSNFFAPLLTGRKSPYSTRKVPLESDWYFKDDALRDPVAFPGDHPTVLKSFPPSLLLSGTRDIGLSQVVATHARLIDAGVDAELHVFEGGTHCAFAAADADPSVPELRHAWRVILRFFDSHLSTGAQ